VGQLNPDTAQHVSASANTGAAAPAAEPGLLRRYARSLRHDRRAAAAHLLLLLLLAAALLAPFYPADPMEQQLTRALSPPSTRAADTGIPGLGGDGPPSYLGTDDLGRDLAARLLLALRISLAVGGLSVAVAAGVGTVLGLLAGYFGGVVDSMIMRVVDALLSLPFVVLAIAIVAAIGPGLVNVAMVLGLTGWVTFARLVRGEVLRLRELPFIEAAHATGCSSLRILLRHLAPQVVGLVLVTITLSLGQMIIAEATLSFLGLGIPPPAPTLGGILSGAQQTFFAAWWVVVFPGVLLMLLVLSVNLVGDFMRDFLDPHVRGAVAARRRRRRRRPARAGHPSYRSAP
jgi:peptide/nickel transport system permease protein